MQTSYLLFLILLSYKSASADTLHSRNGEGDSAVTIIINNTSKSNLELTYRNKYNDEEVLYSHTVNDTICLGSIDFVPLNIKYANKNVLFPLMKGDSLVIRSPVTENWEWKVINNKKKEGDTSFFRLCNEALGSEYQKLKNLLFSSLPASVDTSKPYIVKSDRMVNKRKYYFDYYEQSAKINKSEWEILDSLEKDNKISLEYIYVYGAVINSRYMGDVIQCYSQTKSNRFLSLLVHNDKYFRNEYLQFDAGGYKDMLYNYIWSVIAKGKFHKQGSNGISIDYKAVYDSADAYFGNEIGEYIKFICLKNIKEERPSTEYKNYFSQFRKAIRDTGYVNYFETAYGYSQNDEASDLLRTFPGPGDLSLRSVLEDSAARIIYADIWASWCAPCIALMPAAEKLQKEFSGKGIKFMYLSVDLNYAAWKNAVIRHGLNAYPSYLFANPPDAGFLNKLKVKTIPRYVIIGKAGNIISKDAPAPDTKEIRAIFNQLLK